MDKKIRILSNEEVINIIRSKPQMHFKSGEANAAELISGLLEEAIREGCESAKVDSISNWWYIKFQKDWVTSLGVERYFNESLKFDIGISGGVRMGILINAFADDVSFFSMDKKYTIKGHLVREIKLDDIFKCCFVFRINKISGVEVKML